MSATLYIRSKNPADINSADLEELCVELGGIPGIEPELRERDREGGDRKSVTWFEIVEQYLLSPVDGAIVGAIVAAFVAWARKRHQERPGRRPTSTVIYGPDNKPLKRVTVKDAESDPDVEDAPPY